MVYEIPVSKNIQKQNPTKPNLFVSTKFCNELFIYTRYKHLPTVFLSASDFSQLTICLFVLEQTEIIPGNSLLPTQAQFVPLSASMIGWIVSDH